MGLWVMADAVYMTSWVIRSAVSIYEIQKAKTKQKLLDEVINVGF